MDRRINLADIIEEKVDENVFLEFMKKSCNMGLCIY